MTREKHSTNIPRLAEVCLQVLVDKWLNDKGSLGGAFGLLHYLNYRSTHDVDAWWNEQITTSEKEQVINAIKTVLSRHGQVGGCCQY